MLEVKLVGEEGKQQERSKSILKDTKGETTNVLCLPKCMLICSLLLFVCSFLLLCLTFCVHFVCWSKRLSIFLPHLNRR